MANVNYTHIHTYLQPYLPGVAWHFRNVRLEKSIEKLLMNFKYNVATKQLRCQ